MTQDKLIYKFLSGGTSGKASNMEIKGEYFYSYFNSLCKKVGDVIFIESRVNHDWQSTRHWWDMLSSMHTTKFISVFRLGNAKPDGDFKYEIDRRLRYIADTVDKMKRSRSHTLFHLQRFSFLTHELKYFVDSINEIFNLNLSMPVLPQPNPKEKYVRDKEKKMLEDIHNIMAGGNLPDAVFKKIEKDWRDRYFISFEHTNSYGWGDCVVRISDYSEIPKLSSVRTTDHEVLLAYPLKITEEAKETIRKYIVKEML